MGGDSFLTLVNQTLEEAMLAEGFSQVFLNEMVAPITRVNYGQSVRISGFAGMFKLYWMFVTFLGSESVYLFKYTLKCCLYIK